MVWRWATYQGFNLGIRANILTFCSFRRRLYFDRCASEELQTYTAIVAGSKSSALLLRMVVTRPIALLRKLRPDLQAKVYIDDIKFTLKGIAADLAERMPLVAKDAISIFEEVALSLSLALEGEAGKSNTVTTSPWLENNLRERMTSIGITVTKPSSTWA